MARQIATSDVRNKVTFGAINAMMTEVTPPHLIINMDCTQFAVGYDVQKKLKCSSLDKCPALFSSLKSEAF